MRAFRVHANTRAHTQAALLLRSLARSSGEQVVGAAATIDDVMFVVLRIRRQVRHGAVVQWHHCFAWLHRATGYARLGRLSTRCCCRHWSCVLLWWCEERIARIIIQRHIVKLGLFCTHTGVRTCQHTMLLLHAPLSYRCSFRSLSTVVAHATTNYTPTHIVVIIICLATTSPPRHSR